MVTGFLPVARQFGTPVHPAVTTADVFTGPGFPLQALRRSGHTL